MLKSISQALDLLGCFTSERATWGVTDLAHQLDLSISTVSRMASTLAQYGFLKHDPVSKKYQLGSRLWELGCLAIAHFDLRAASVPYLQRLTEASHETSMLAVVDGADVLYLQVVDGPQPIRFNIYSGARARAFLTSLGKAILAFMPEVEMRRHLDQYLDHYGTEHGTAEVLRDRLVTVRQRGWAFNRGEWHAEVRAIAAPVRDHTGQVIAAIGAAGPASRFTDDFAAAMGPTVKVIADDFSHAIGYPQAGIAIRGAVSGTGGNGSETTQREGNVSS